MKKVLLLLLCLSLVFCFAACNKADNTGANVEVPATSTDVDTEEYIPDPTVTAENEVYITDYAEAAARLGIPALSFPADFEIYRVLLVDEDKVQVEFTCNEVSYLGQYMVGMQENASGLSGSFDQNEEVQLAGWNIKMEYTPISEEEAGAEGKPKHLALAEGYDSASNITAWLVCQDFTETASFQPVVEAFLGCLTAAPAAETEAE